MCRPPRLAHRPDTLTTPPPRPTSENGRRVARRVAVVGPVDDAAERLGEDGRRRPGPQAGPDGGQLVAAGHVVASGPDDLPAGIGGLDSVALSFATPVDESALARLTTVELAPQPGAAESGHQTLTAADFTITAQERGSRSDRQTYLVALRHPVPDGRIATLRLRLSDEPGLDDPTFSMALHSAVPFTETNASCGGSYTSHPADGVLQCQPDPAAPGPRSLDLSFTAPAAGLDIVAARQALRFTPPVDDLDIAASGGTNVSIRAKFVAGQIYTLTVDAGTLHDTAGRPLAARFTETFAFQAGQPALAWDAAQGIAERLGPQMVPLRGHGYDHADMRIVPIDPLSRDFWPFPRAGLATRDDTPPPLPGREPEAYANAEPIPGTAMAERITALGTAAVSELVDLPIRPGGVDAKFGLDISGELARIAGARQPGAYLLGLRRTDGGLRQWMRVQVTDLSLSSIEESDRVRFYVTSLATARPVAGAEIRVEGTRDDGFATLAHGVTDKDGAWVVPAPLLSGHYGGDPDLRRLVVAKGTDTLVLDPHAGRIPRYTQGLWSDAGGPWLDWLAHSPAARRPTPQTQCHVFTERPIYRPEEPVLVAGMIRTWDRGALTYASGPGEVVVSGPGDQQWRLPAPLDEVGGFHVRFDAKTTATGEYTIAWERNGDPACGGVTVKKEAYRLPTFEVVLNAPARTSLDKPFDVSLAARFFAGGTLSDRPVLWRATQEPFVWSPPDREGFLFSSDSRFSGDAAFRSTPVLTRDTKTDAGGGARLTLDPTLEPTAQPRAYLVEATVTGDDDMQVRGTQRVIALPPFVLGIKVPRYIEKPGSIDAQLLALDGEGHAAAGQTMTVRLIHRQWNSILQASDFSQGSAKYETQVLDQVVEERHVTAGADPLPAHFAVPEAGVYLVELEAADRVGRVQKVRVDLFMAGGTPVTWSRPPSQVVRLTADRDKYDPGQTAAVLVESPFQTGRALMVVEQPDGHFRADWIDIAHGYGRYAVPLRKEQVPRLAVHALVMRGRLPGEASATTPFDQGKPATVAGTAWLNVTPIEHTVVARFDAPAEARPGQAIDLTLHLADARGAPLSGEATVWLVDQAVLSLAREQKLDPVPAFIVDRPTRFVARDTRNMALGVLKMSEDPGGDEHGDHGLANITVRKNFTPVPFYAPRVHVGLDGAARLHVQLPDSLTVFMLRAKAVSGPDRFGFGTGELRVRLPVVAQAALPRFVRPGDRFQAGLIARVVEGPGGAGRSRIAVENLHVEGAADQNFAWNGSHPARIDTLLSVPDPPFGTNAARVKMVAQRASDGVGDAVQLDLPIRPDRRSEHRRALLTAGAGTLDIPPPVDRMRPGTYRQRVTAATDPELVRLLAGIDLLTRDPDLGPEQSMALASAELALLPFTPLIDAAGLQDRVAGDVASAIAMIKRATDEDGRVAFWPGIPGTIWFTADAYRLLVAAGRAGLPVEKPLVDHLAGVLTASLRSDYPHVISGYEAFERVDALAALADGGQIDSSYADELARRAQLLPTRGVAYIAAALSRLKQADPRLVGEVMDVLWSRVNIFSRDGHPAYGGLRDEAATDAILPSETASLAQVLRAVATATPDDPRREVLRAGLVGLADGQGWGSTYATSAALRALASTWRLPQTPVPVSLLMPDRLVSEVLNQVTPLVQARTAQQGAAHVQVAAAIGAGHLAVLSSTDGVPVQPGAQAQARQDGIVVNRVFYRVREGHPLARLDPAADGMLHLHVGDVVEEQDDLETLEDRSNLALHAPLAAGMEPLNPALATATADAAPSAPPTLPPSYARYGDDEFFGVWLSFPSGTATLRTRMRATIPGTFTAPPAVAEALYRPGISGTSAGLRIVIEQ